MTAMNKGTVQVSKQERILYGGDWAALVRRLGDAAQATEDARSLAEQALRECVRDDGLTGGERDAQGRSPETVRRLSIVEQVAKVEQATLRVFREIANECSTHNRDRRLAEPSTCADASSAPDVVVAAAPGVVEAAALKASTFRAGGRTGTYV